MSTKKCKGRHQNKKERKYQGKIPKEMCVKIPSKIQISNPGGQSQFFTEISFLNASQTPSIKEKENNLICPNMSFSMQCPRGPVAIQMFSILKI